LRGSELQTRQMRIQTAAGEQLLNKEGYIEAVLKSGRGGLSP